MKSVKALSILLLLFSCSKPDSSNLEEPAQHGGGIVVSVGTDGRGPSEETLREKFVYDIKTGLGETVDLTEAERIANLGGFSSLEEKAIARKLEKIKEIRLQKLQQTDWWVLRGNMTEAQSDWRQSLRNIPANHTNEEAYDLLLARDSSDQLTHAIWSKP